MLPCLLFSTGFYYLRNYKVYYFNVYSFISNLKSCNRHCNRTDGNSINEVSTICFRGACIMLLLFILNVVCKTPIHDEFDEQETNF